MIASVLCFASMQASQAPQVQNPAPHVQIKVAVSAVIKLVHRCTGQTPGLTFFPPNPQVRLLDAQKPILHKINLSKGQSISLASMKAQCPANVDTAQLTSIKDYANGYLFNLIPKNITK